MIKSGEKKEEYREIKPYYTSRFREYLSIPCIIDRTTVHIANPKFEIIFRNGYKKDSPKIKCKCELNIGEGKEEWGAEPNKKYYILEILEVINEK